MTVQQGFMANYIYFENWKVKEIKCNVPAKDNSIPLP